MSATAAAVLLSACGAGDSRDDITETGDRVEMPETTGSSTTTTTTTTIEPDAEVKVEVEQTYLAYFDSYFDLFSAPNPDAPEISILLSGPARDKALETIAELVLEGHSIRPPVSDSDFQIQILETTLHGGSATVRGCLVDGSRLVANGTGEVLNDVIATYLIESQLILTDRWRIETVAVIERREGRWSCD